MLRIKMLKAQIDGGRTLGRNGIYVVADKLGRRLEERGACDVIEVVSKDVVEVSPLQTAEDAEFLTVFKRNAPVLLAILEAAHGKMVRDRDVEDEAKYKADQGVENENPDPLVPESPSPTEGSNSNPLAEITETTEEAKLTAAEVAERLMRNPEAPVGTAIGEDFPGHKVLETASITTVEKIPDTLEKIMQVKGMTQRLANQIQRKLIELGYRTEA